MRAIDTTKLNNGVTITTSTVPSVGSAAVGVCIRGGVRYQRPDENGYAHLLEHLLFGATAQGPELSARFASMGGRVNAMAGRELISLSGIVPGSHANELVAIFAERLCSPSFAEDELARERQIVLQEMERGRTLVDEALEERVIGEVWRGHPIARPLLGDRDSVARANAESLRGYFAANITGNRIHVVATGSVRHSDIVSAAAALEKLDAGIVAHDEAPGFRGGALTIGDRERMSHLVWALPAPCAAEPSATLQIANVLLAASMTSRLYRSLRDDAALCYGVSSRTIQYADCGVLLIQAVCDADDSTRCRALVDKDMDELLDRGPLSSELEAGIRGTQSNAIVETDNLEMRIEQLAHESVYLGHHRTLEQRCAAFSRITAEDIAEFLRRAWPQRFVLEWTI